MYKIPVKLSVPNNFQICLSNKTLRYIDMKAFEFFSIPGFKVGTKLSKLGYLIICHDIIIVISVAEPVKAGFFAGSVSSSIYRVV